MWNEMGTRVPMMITTRWTMTLIGLTMKMIDDGTYYSYNFYVVAESSTPEVRDCLRSIWELV